MSLTLIQTLLPFVSFVFFVPFVVCLLGNPST